MENIAVDTISEFPYHEITDACFEWCAMEQVVHSNNTELYSIGLVLGAYVMIMLHNWFEHFPKLKKYQYGCIYLSRIFLIIFFLYYVVFVKYKII